MKRAKSLLLAALLGAAALPASADEQELQKYQHARIAVTYKGNVGDLAQQLAEKLGIGYYAAQHNSTAPIKLKQDDSKNLQHLFDQINAQLNQQQIRFDMLDDKVILALVGNNVSLAPTQFIGNVIYSEAPAEKTANTEGNHISAPVLALPTAVQTAAPSVATPQPAEAKPAEVKPTEEKPAETNSAEVKPTEANTAAAKALEALPAATLPTNNTGTATPATQPATPQPTNAVMEAEAKKLQTILTLSQDAKLLAQYSKRVQPLYNVQDKAALALETVRSTKISTFLIFNDKVDVSHYRVEGSFQDIAKFGNVIAILHRQKRPPQEILITPPNQPTQKLVKAN